MNQTKKFSLFSSICAAMLFVASNANAVTFDFVALAAGNERGFLSDSFTSGSITVTATANDANTGAQLFAYLDDLSGGDPGGLGVCKQIRPNGTCADETDDNIGEFELLNLNFSEKVNITEITFSNGDHVDLYNGDFGVRIDGLPASPFYYIYSQIPVFSGSLLGTSFSFASNSTFADPVTTRDMIYISSITVEAVPEPLTVGLLGMGLVPLLRRRRS